MRNVAEYFCVAAASVAAALVLWIAVAAASEQTSPPPNVQALGPRVGDRVPDFTLTDQHGESRTLASLMGPGGLMLVFYRSADW